MFKRGVNIGINFCLPFCSPKLFRKVQSYKKRHCGDADIDSPRVLFDKPLKGIIYFCSQRKEKKEEINDTTSTFSTRCTFLWQIHHRSEPSHAQSPDKEELVKSSASPLSHQYNHHPHPIPHCQVHLGGQNKWTLFKCFGHPIACAHFFETYPSKPKPKLPTPNPLKTHPRQRPRACSGTS